MMSNKHVLDVPGRGEPSAISFEEWSVRLQLGGLALSLTGYLFLASRMLASGVTALPAFGAVFAVSVVLLIVFLIGGHIAVAIVRRPDGRDERDRLIGWRGEARSGWLLASGIVIGLGCLVIGVPNVWTANLLLVSLYLGEMLGLALQLVDYRRGF